MTNKYWYRYDDLVVDEYRIEIMLTTYRVLKYTEHGVWLELGYSAKRFVKNSSRKKFACPTIDEAKISFQKRKERQLRILTAQSRRVERVLHALEKNETIWDDLDEIEYVMSDVRKEFKGESSC